MYYGLVVCGFGLVVWFVCWFLADCCGLCSCLGLAFVDSLLWPVGLL